MTVKRMEIRMDLEVQPRRSAESMGILGANRARLEFDDIYAFPQESRWVFRNRLHPIIPGKNTSVGEVEGETGDPASGDGMDTLIPSGSGGRGGDFGGRGGGQDTQLGGGRKEG